MRREILTVRRNGKSKDIFGIGNMMVRKHKTGFIASIFMDQFKLGVAKKATRKQIEASIKAAEKFVADAKKVLRSK